MKRPKTAHSYRRSGGIDPKFAWEAEDSLQISQILPQERKRVLGLRLKNTMYEQPIENNEDLTIFSHGKQNGVNNNGNDLKDPEYFYLTSHQKDFRKHHISPTQTARPKSSKFYSSYSKVGKSSYQEDFLGGGSGANSAESKSSDDPKRNNPHPLEGFTVWRFPRQLPPPEPVHDLDVEAIECASKRLLQSTYKMDYLGTPQGVRLEEKKDNIPLMNSINPPFTLDSTKRIDYQLPQVHENLKNNTSKYGCNSLKHIPATGGVPNAFLKSTTMQKSGATTYSDEFTDKSESKRRMIPFEG